MFQTVVIKICSAANGVAKRILVYYFGTRNNGTFGVAIKPSFLNGYREEHLNFGILTRIGSDFRSLRS
ncbi:hypothetical protein RN001_008434 [Aquatica leii]|uniref:Uncharacterized protein n=1 Tax=Aquatica leii TaxID=1421715 RepID=A0AAN7SP86_9COLE|nr:hypothetical protein RN001_008434 [Aquatica leii]